MVLPVCFVWFTLKHDQYSYVVPVFLSGTICSVQVDADSMENRLIDSVSSTELSRELLLNRTCMPGGGLELGLYFQVGIYCDGLSWSPMDKLAIQLFTKFCSYPVKCLKIFCVWIAIP